MVLFSRILAELPWEMRIYWATLQGNVRVKFPNFPCPSEGSFSQLPSAAHTKYLPLEPVVLHSNTSTPVQKLLGSWTWYFRNLVSIGLRDMMLKISVVAGMRSPNSGQPKGVSSGKDALQNCSRAGREPENSACQHWLCASWPGEELLWSFMKTMTGWLVT